MAEGDAVPQRQVALLQIEQLEAARLGGEQHGECGVLHILDLVDRVHDDGKPHTFAHLIIPESGTRSSLLARRRGSKAESGDYARCAANMLLASTFGRCAAPDLQKT